MGRIVRSPESDADIDEVTLFIARHSLDAALRLVDRLDEKLKLLAWMPQLGPERPELGADIRTLPLGSYLIVYRPIRGGIELVRFLHGSRNLRRLFRRRPKK
jgi:toxin ParE1/3/4